MAISSGRKGSIYHSQKENCSGLNTLLRTCDWLIAISSYEIATVSPRRHDQPPQVAAL
jgi:hypothetical protein